MAETKLREAARLLEQRGLCYAKWLDMVDGRVCLEGAIGLAYGDAHALQHANWTDNNGPVIADALAVVDVIRDLQPNLVAVPPVSVITAYNDRWATDAHGIYRPTTIADAVAVLEKAAARREEMVSAETSDDGAS